VPSVKLATVAALAGAANATAVAAAMRKCFMLELQN
jgi:hypothetical protein